MKKISIFFVLFIFSACSCNDVPPPPPPTFIKIEAEDFKSAEGMFRIEDHPEASGAQSVHIGPDSDIADEGIGSSLTFQIQLENNFKLAVMKVIYSDDVSRNIMHVYLDGVNTGCFRSEDTGTWTDFIVADQKINLGQISQGDHSITLKLTGSGSWGIMLDYFSITNVEQPNTETAAYDYVKDLINPATGLVQSTEYDNQFTTIYKNALAAMVFIHNNEISLAEGIFDFFNSKFDAEDFAGFNKNWNAETGEELAEDFWVGDNAFLLLSLNYYNKVNDSYGKYEAMKEGLIQWLVDKSDEDIIAEGLANMYAALKPFELTHSGMDTVLSSLSEEFDIKKDYQNVLDHIERGALCFDDLSGFEFIDNFARTENWLYNEKEISLLSAFSSETFVNVEITAQILLAWKLKKTSLSVDFSYLESELDKIWLLGFKSPEHVTFGLPYFLSSDETGAPGYGWPYCYDAPIIDPVCYMLFYYWEFNPMLF